MSIALEKAVNHYALLDRRVAPRQAAILRSLRSLEGPQHPEAARQLDRIAHNTYLLFDEKFKHQMGAPGDYRPALFQDLDQLLAVLQGDEIVPMALLLGRLDEKLSGMLQAQDIDAGVNLDDLGSKILIGNIAFLNYCFMACSHCGSANSWDARKHSLSALEGVLPKIHFPRLSHVTFSWHEPFTLPFLLDAVELLLEHGARVGIVSSGYAELRESRIKSEAILSGFRRLSEKYPGKILLALSFDLFRRREIGAYLDYIAEMLDRHPFISQLKPLYSRENRKLTFGCLRQLLDKVASADGKTIVRQALEQGFERAAKDLYPLGAALPSFISGDSRASVAKEYLYGHKAFSAEERLSPNIHPFMLFAGGDIVPACNFAAAHIRSVGNIFVHSVEEIYARFAAFEARYLQFIQEGLSSYPALVLTESTRRSALGIDPYFATHFDALASAIIKNDQKLATKRGKACAFNFVDIVGWVDQGLASWQGIGIFWSELSDFYKPLFLAEVRKQLDKPDTMDPQIYAYIKLAVDKEMVTYEELGMKKEVLEAILDAIA